jgi:hypothetical protein
VAALFSSATNLPASRGARSRTAPPGAVAAIGLAFAAGWTGLAGAQEPAAVEQAQPHSDVRAQTRIVHRSSTAITEAQATELTLTLTEVAVRPIQTWVRTAGTLDKTRRLLTTSLRSPEAERVAVGQRVRTFSLAQRTQMYQAKITRISPEVGGARVEATIATEVRDFGAPYLMEIVVEQGPFLSVPNVSIIEEGADKVVYVQQASGEYAARTIQTGLEGELYTQVLEGLAEGDQIVSIGSFFVDADNKLKGGSE